MNVIPMKLMTISLTVLTLVGCRIHCLGCWNYCGICGWILKVQHQMVPVHTISGIRFQSRKN